MKSVLVLSFHLILLVRDSLAFSHPSLPIFLKPLLTESEDFHTMVEQRILLDHIDDVDFDFQIFIGGVVLSFEVEPLVVAFSVDIVLQD